MRKSTIGAWVLGILTVATLYYWVLMPVRIYVSQAAPDKQIRVSVLLNESILYDETNKNEPHYWMSAPMVFNINFSNAFIANDFAVIIYDSEGSILNRTDTTLHTIFRKHITIDYIDNMSCSNTTRIQKHLTHEIILE